LAITIRQQLDQSGLFQHFPADAKQKLAGFCHTQIYADGEMIYLKGDEPTALYGVLDGAIKLIGEDPSGKFFLFGLEGPGRWFGESSALDGERRGQSAQAVGEARILSLPRGDLMKLLDAKPELYRHFVSVFCRRLRLAGERFEDTAFLPVNIRLAKNLLQMHRVREQHGIKLPQEELAASLGVTRQSIYRVIKEWQQKGWVSTHYGDVRVESVEQLQLLVNNYVG
jgi:CRP-like cAMP-binding protein